MNLDERLSEIEQWYESTFDSVDGKPLAIGGDLLALAREYRDENARLKDIIMAGAKGAGFDEVETALEDANNDVDRLTDELAEAVWLLHKMRRAMREENTTHGVALFDYAGQADAFLARHEGEKHE
jgi:hypothetical protein